MITQITNNVQVSVETYYQPGQSNPLSHEFMFAYRIVIDNFSNRSVRLLNRHWYIFDSCGIHREVQGEGVIGKRPLIEPSGSYEYVSGCNLRSEIGRMHGTYLMQRPSDGGCFTVIIPKFLLIAPFKLS